MLLISVPICVICGEKNLRATDVTDGTDGVLGDVWVLSFFAADEVARAGGRQNFRIFGISVWGLWVMNDVGWS